MNRAPSAQDNWWPRHVQSCGGSYTKVKEPEGYGEKKTKKVTKENSEKTGKPPAGKSKYYQEINSGNNIIVNSVDSNITLLLRSCISRFQVMSLHN